MRKVHFVLVTLLLAGCGPHPGYDVDAYAAWAGRALPSSRRAFAERPERL